MHLYPIVERTHFKSLAMVKECACMSSYTALQIPHQVTSFKSIFQPERLVHTSPVNRNLHFSKCYKILEFNWNVCYSYLIQHFICCLHCITTNFISNVSYAQFTITPYCVVIGMLEMNKPEIKNAIKTTKSF